MSVNDLPVGRCVEETLRLVKAFQFVETHGEVCPASWTPHSPTVSTPGLCFSPFKTITANVDLIPYTFFFPPFSVFVMFVFQIKPTPEGSKEYFEKVN